MIRPAPSDPPEIDAKLWEGFTPGEIGLDIGANCGQSIPHMKALATQVWAYEPSVESFEELSRQYGSDSAVQLFMLAASDEDSTIELMASPSKIDTGQLVTHGTSGMEWSEEEMAQGEVREIPAVTLDSHLSGLYSRVGFIKIDVEGHELRVLRGALQLIESSRPEMLIEIHSEELGEDIFDLLKSQYAVETVRHPHYEFGSLLWRTHFWYKCLPQ